MPHSCCSLCPEKRRILSNEKKRKLCEPKIWCLINSYLASNSRTVQLDRNGLICRQCYSKLLNGNGNDIWLVSTTEEQSHEEPIPSQEFDLVSSLPMSLYGSQTHNPTWPTSDFDLISSMDLDIDDSDNEIPTASLSTPTESQQHSFAEPSRLMELPFQSCRRTERCCFLCGSTHGRGRVPKPAVMDVWLNSQVYIPLTNRCCRNHLNERELFTEDAKLFIQADKSVSKLTPEEITTFILDLTDKCNNASTKLNFEENSPLSSDNYKLLCGLEKQQFHDVLTHCKRIKKSANRSPASALAIFLMKIRLNISQEVLAFLFNIDSQACISDTIGTVAKVLEDEFVSKNLGYAHITRADFIKNHNSAYFHSVLGSAPTSAIAIIDATYLFIQKSSDHELQRRTFSGHKKRNLLKPMIICGTDGYVLEMEGLYLADGRNNDAGILNSMMRSEEGFTTFFVGQDDLILDRGFRDSINTAKESDYNAVMPRLLKKGQKQFETMDANESRRVSMLRWVVESVNGRLKNMFPFFSSTIPNSYIPRLRSLTRIAIALINCYSPPLFVESEVHAGLAEVAVERMTIPNALHQKLLDEEMLNKKSIWVEQGVTDVASFPQLSLEDLKTITLGSYQTYMASLYTRQLMASSAGFVFSQHRTENGLLRMKIPSRFQSMKFHQIFVQFVPDRTGPEAIVGWYCTCKTGARTVGCCSHVATLIWFLSYGRHHPKIIKPRQVKFMNYIMDASIVQPVEAEDSDSDMDLGDP